MPTTTVKIYEVNNSYVSNGGSSLILGEFTMTIDDNDSRLHADEGADPGAPQTLTTDAGTVTDYDFIYDDTSTINGESVTIKTFQLTIGGVTRSFVMSDDSRALDGVEAGDTITLGTFANYSSIPYSSIACFTAGTLIETVNGVLPVEDITLGTLVVTRDNGAQPVRWAGTTHVSGRHLSQNTSLRPVQFDVGALGPNSPSAPLALSPQHRVLLEGWSVELTTGHTEVLVAAKHLKGQPGIRAGRWKDGVTYVHIMFDDHEVITANGAPCESFLFGDAIQSDLPSAQEEEIRALFPELTEQPLLPARPVLKRRETKALLRA